jgi:hypothetical protein
MKYFLHDTNSFDDEKITELFIKFGYEGLGLFYTLLEKIAKQEKPVKTSVLKTQLKVKKRLEKCWCFMEEIGLISSRNGETFNEKLLNYSEMYQIKKEKTRKKVQEWREKQSDANTVTGYVPVSNLPKVKLSKVKESNINNIESRETIFNSEVWQFKDQYSDSMIRKFINYWTEKNKSKTRMRFELEKTFEIPRRLNTWANNDKNYGTKKTIGADPYELAILEANKLGIQH